MKNKSDKGGLVYSTVKELDLNNPSDDEPDTLPNNQQDLRITIDKKLKGGKQATVVYRFVGKSEDLETLGKRLKTVCGVGGTSKNGEIILQGECLEKVKTELTRQGYRFKVAGI